MELHNGLGLGFRVRISGKYSAKTLILAMGLTGPLIVETFLCVMLVCVKAYAD